ncbi:Lrp/AsnC family transcriptional regulator [Leisingera sp.]|uniref:Lrp/AsnC family transcriptional regulator n=1 Tax=Leisingera sp. TaxID=1879318 RepID=UPI002B26B3D3|nr:Lrp/AsnC family transcriptional regulator [Leisingera sp.]
MIIDRTNKRILALLEQNARLSAAAVGREIGLSRPAVQDRIAAMEQQGVIKGYHAETDERAGLTHAVLFVRIAERPCDRALRWLASLDGVAAVASLSGETDALVTVALPSVSELAALNDTVAASPLIASSLSQVVLKRLTGV